MPFDAVTLRRYRRAFGWALLVSVAALAASSYILLAASPHPASASTPSELSLYVSTASLATSAASLVGFLFTSALAWRRERRESRHSEVDLEKKKLEVEKLRRELEGGRGKAGSQPVSPSTRSRRRRR